MEDLIQTFIYIHAAFGGLALLGGLAAMIARKGSKTHRRGGLVFYYAMMISGIIAMAVALMPRHENMFLFAVGVFSLYFVIIGYRAVRWKEGPRPLVIDKVISSIMAATGLLMILWPVLLHGVVNIVLTVFGIVGLVFSVRNLRLFQRPQRLSQVWLKMHLGHMLGGYIAAWTAFVVVGEYMPGITGWFVPGILGGMVITYWMRRVSRRQDTSA